MRAQSNPHTIPAISVFERFIDDLSVCRCLQLSVNGQNYKTLEEFLPNSYSIILFSYASLSFSSSKGSDFYTPRPYSASR